MLREVQEEMAHLEDLFYLINDTVTFHLTLIWGVLAFVVASAGAALYALAKIWVDKRVKTEMNTIDERILTLIRNNRVRFASGQSSLYEGKTEIGGLENFDASSKILMFQLFSRDGTAFYKSYEITPHNHIYATIHNPSLKSNIVEWYLVWSNDNVNN